MEGSAKQKKSCTKSKEEKEYSFEEKKYDIICFKK